MDNHSLHESVGGLHDNRLPKPQTSSVLNRRNLLKKTALLGVGSALSVKAPYVFARNKTKIRVLGTHVTLQEELKKQAMEELGIEIEYEPGGSATVLQKALISPDSFDLYEQWSNSIKVLWRSGSIQSIDKNKITYWNEVNDLCRTGKLTPEAKLGAGDAPFRIINVQPDGSLSSEETDKISFLPYVHNVDSFGYNTNNIPPGEPYVTESWGWLLDKKYSGKVGIINAPTIGIFDLALAAQAHGELNFQDIGNLTMEELDKLFAVLIDLKKQGHFSGFWNSVPESVDFMKSGRVIIESMFSPAVSALNGKGVPVTYAAPKEGYRGWHGVMCLSSRTEGREKAAAYEYMNWWLSGWPGAFIARQGYYISNPSRSASYLSTEEWDYWYQGKPARQALKGTDGQLSVKAGESRTGGSYTKRLSNVAVWNTVMDSYDYSLQKWYELISS